MDKLKKLLNKKVAAAVIGLVVAVSAALGYVDVKNAACTVAKVMTLQTDGCNVDAD